VKRLLLLILTFFILTNMAAARPIIIERTQSDWTCYDLLILRRRTLDGVA
jgi:hypothetical protein